MELPYRQRHESQPVYKQKRFLLGLDFGATCSAGVFCLESEDMKKLKAGRIIAFTRYKDSDSDVKGTNTEVESVVRYEEHAVRTGLAALRETSLPGVLVSYAKLGLLDQGCFAGTRKRLFETLRQASDITNKVNTPAKEKQPENFEKSVGHDVSCVTKTPEDVITDLLKDMFASWKEELEGFGYNERDSLMLHCAVPADWKGGAPMFKLATAIEKASVEAGLAIDKAIRWWPEPEAALAYVAKHNAQFFPEVNETVMMIDAGGGTTDVTMYTVLNTQPLQVREAMSGQSVALGSSLLEVGFRHQLEDRTADLTYFTTVQRQQLIEIAVRLFQKEIKTTFDGRGQRFVIFPGLRPDDAKGFREGLLQITEQQIKSIFDPVLEGIVEMVLNMIKRAQKKKITLNAVLMVGGFSGSPYFRDFLKRRIVAETQDLVTPPEIDSPRMQNYSIAEGALLCKMHKLVGHRRVSSCSVGIKLDIPYDKNNLAHRDANPIYSSLNRKQWVMDCLCWILKMDELIPKKIEPVEFLVEIPSDCEVFPYTLQLFTSVNNKMDCFPADHRKNKGTQGWGKVSVDIDMTKVRAEQAIVYTDKPTMINSRERLQSTEHAGRRSQRIQERVRTSEVLSTLSKPGIKGNVIIRDDTDITRVNASSWETSSEVQCLAISDGADRVNKVIEKEESSPRRYGYYPVNLELHLEIDDLVGTWTLKCPSIGLSQLAKFSLTPFIA